MHINQLINPASLNHDIENGFIRVQTHPSLPLKIYNYTEKAQFSRHWNKATLSCRGLIVHHDGTVVARPFPKFFNWDEPKPKGLEHQMDLDEFVSVSDKLDGSLGILYPEGNGGFAIATRGSFTSDQALHGTKVWRDRHEDAFIQLNPRLTYLFEIIYPENRIVVDYDGLDDLVLIGAVDTEGGFIYGPEMVSGWMGHKARVFPYRTLRQAVSAKPRAGKEGFVVRSLSTSLMVKIKQEDYVSLHRVVTGLNEKEIWRRCMKADLELPPEVERMSTVLRDIPDELHEWVKTVASRLVSDFRVKLNLATRTFYQVRPRGSIFHQLERSHRKEFALRTKDHDTWLRKALWIIYDGNDPREFLWKTVEPRGDAKK